MRRAQTDKRSAKPATDLKTLSGGERSFVTICFILALGKRLNVRSPAQDMLKDWPRSAWVLCVLAILQLCVRVPSGLVDRAVPRSRLHAEHATCNTC